MIRSIYNLTLVHKIKDCLLKKMYIDSILFYLAKKGLTANMITFTSFSFGIISIYYLFNNSKLFALFYIISRLLDGLDGYFARHFITSSSKGLDYDHISDFVLHISLLLKTIFYTNLTVIATISLTIYILELLLLKKQNALDKKFPTSLSAYFFVFNLYLYGLVIQISYQIISYLIFVYQKNPRLKKIILQIIS